ncbi:unnamed protein product [Acanthoscelides obtectus]|uniref:Dihydrolipoyllysine-residue succinyltransferase component of 2-oxoglutarate dehydrogenase complex, mitochondrial n=1 Tax=Acanthoscelides obtectus TaxID=200917 RepID=A0A9P0JMH5_ACAOB
MSMLTLVIRNVPRIAIRNLSSYVEKAALEVPLRQRTVYHGTKIVRKYSIKSNHGVSARLCCRTHETISVRTDRYFRTTSACLESMVVKVPPFAESVTEGDVRIEKKVGDHIGQDEVVMEIETDKTSMPVHCPAAGIIEEFLVKDGDTVKPGQDLFKLKVTGEAPPPKPAAAAAPPPPKPEPAAAPPPPPPPPTPQVKMNRMRLKIAERLKEAQNVNAMLTTFNEIDMSNIMEFRKANLEAFQKKYGMKLSFMSAFLKASAYALQDQPVVNAVIDGQEIVYRDYVDISVAVATPKGLVVPVIRNVESMNFADIENAMAQLADKARKGKIAIEDMDGGTFTISNGGVFGSLMGTPIINPPQSSILGMHAIFDRPVAIKGQVVIRPMMYVALTYDHRLIDGREAVLFLRKIKQAVEDPRVILAGL